MLRKTAREYILATTGKLQLSLPSIQVDREAVLFLGCDPAEVGIAQSIIMPASNVSYLRLLPPSYVPDAASKDLCLVTPTYLSAHVEIQKALEHFPLLFCGLSSSIEYPNKNSSELGSPLRNLFLNGTNGLELKDASYSSSYDAILIDDDELVHRTWSLVAKKLGKEVCGFRTAEEFYGAVHLLPKAVPVFIDFHLGRQTGGDVVAAYASLFGFSIIHIQSGFAPNALLELPWITAIHGKTTPWEDELKRISKPQR
ncbi:MAG: hypothetical protein EOP04_32555 [Proteobacteria bacterium]|nr:MAG: hypothetical protein EOP04_32555 [Pseudomonadota bacterium]